MLPMQDEVLQCKIFTINIVRNAKRWNPAEKRNHNSCNIFGPILREELDHLMIQNVSSSNVFCNDNTTTLNSKYNPDSKTVWTDVLLPLSKFCGKINLQKNQVK